jgi:hypothetical protein
VQQDRGCGPGEARNSHGLIQTSRRFQSTKSEITRGSLKKRASQKAIIEELREKRASRAITLTKNWACAFNAVAQLMDSSIAPNTVRNIGRRGAIGTGQKEQRNG